VKSPEDGNQQIGAWHLYVAPLPLRQYLRFENLRLTTTAAPGNRPIGVLIPGSYLPVDPHHITFADCEIDHLKHGLTWYEHGHVLERCHIYDNYGIAPEMDLRG
jgi:hypothetical protein